MKKFLKSAIIATLVLSLVACFGFRSSHWRAYHDIEDDLELTQVQEDKFDNLKDNMRKSFKQHYKDNNDKQQLLDLLDAQMLDQDKAISLLKQQNAKKQDLIQGIIPDVAAFTNSLTPEQRAKLKRKLKRRNYHRDAYNHPHF